MRSRSSICAGSRANPTNRGLSNASHHDGYQVFLPRNIRLQSKSLLAVLAIFAALSAFRAYHYWVTGFFVSDEYGYVTSALQGTSAVPDRWFFAWMNIAIFRILGINNIDAYAFFLPFYLFFWSALTLTMAFLIFRLLNTDGTSLSLTLVSSIFLVAFSLLALGFLTETPGLALAMVGIYCLLRFTREGSFRAKTIFALLSSLFFSAAAGTREPYLVFSIGGIFAVFATGLNARSAGSSGKRNSAIFTVLFALPALFFLQYPTGLLLHTLVPLGGSVSSSFSQFIGAGGAHNDTSPNGSLVSPSVFNATTPDRLPITGEIFALGLTLGWNPILLAVGGVALALLLWTTIRRRDLTRGMLLAICIFALLSYLGVCYLVSWDSSYLGFRHYSTLIRFSNTAVPAFFLSTPFLFSRFLKSKKRILPFFSLLLLFAVVSFSSYEAYAASNLTYASGNPFLLSYRTPAAGVRDYLAIHELQGHAALMGIPPGWDLTPGVQDLRLTAVPYLNESDFILRHWSAFYVYLPADATSILSQYTYLGELLKNGASQSQGLPVTSVLVATKNSDFVLYKVTIAWQ